MGSRGWTLREGFLWCLNFISGVFFLFYDVVLCLRFLMTVILFIILPFFLLKKFAKHLLLFFITFRITSLTFSPKHPYSWCVNDVRGPVAWVFKSWVCAFSFLCWTPFRLTLNLLFLHFIKTEKKIISDSWSERATRNFKPQTSVLSCFITSLGT